MPDVNTRYTPTASNLAHAEAKAFRVACAEAVAAGVAAVTAVADVDASLTTEFDGANNDLVFTSKLKGASGNHVSIELIDPGEDVAEEEVTVSGLHVAVTLRSETVDETTTVSTAAQVAAAIAGDELADGLIAVDNAAGNNGSGQVEALERTSLSGGKDGLTKEGVVAQAAGVPVETVSRLAQASEMDLNDFFLVYTALDGGGYTAATAVITDYFGDLDPS